MREKAVEAPLTDQLLPELDRVAMSLQADALAELAQQGIEPSRIRAARRAHLRYDGTDTALPVPLGGAAEMVTSFEQAYRQHFSFLMRDKTILVEAVSVECAAASAVQAGQPPNGTQAPNAAPQDQPARPGQSATGATVAMYAAGRWANAPLVRRRDMRPGQWLEGPALIVEDFATTVIEPGWQAERTRLGDLLLSRVAAQEQRLAGTAVDPVMLEIFNNLFMSVAEQMGVRLRSTAHSVNIKERLDFSCAIFDADGGLIANAPHIPVHLGSMGESIMMVVRRNAGQLCAGDVYVLNDPYHGGTHLPDVTVVTPVFDGAGREILFYVASRGHHAEIGGITPGSMPAFSTRVEEEGVLIDNWLLVRGGTLREAETLDLLRSAPYPSRNPEVNLADLRAQIAANEKGVQELGRMVAHFGLDVVRAYNVTIGNEHYQYYETVASGSGAGQGFAGTGVVQTHMTNSRLTDPEVLEWRYPVRLERFAIRPGTGGAGRWPGGDGGRREIRFLEPMTVTTLTSHRRVPPYGMAGGKPGALGRHWVEHADGTATPMRGCDSVAVAAGDLFVIETPGGGGYGSASG